MGVLDLRDEIASNGAEASEAEGDATVATEASSAPVMLPENVVLVGRIGGVPNPWPSAKPDYPWQAGSAQFVLADAAAAAEVADHSHAHTHADGEECPFCATAADATAVAIVQFLDEQGQPISIDARQLFDLTGEETIVVQGKPKFLGESQQGVLMVDASGLYVRR